MAEQSPPEQNEPEQDDRPTRPSGITRTKKTLFWVLGILVLLGVVLYIASFFIDEPLRRYIEQTANKHLKGYAITLSAAHLQLVGGAITLEGLKIIQSAHPDPAVAIVSSSSGTISWRDLFHGKVVATIEIDHPRFHVNLPQLQSEMSSKEKVKGHGWQEAIEAVSPLKINNFILKEGSITYVDKDPDKPLHLNHLNIQASNIRNVRVANNVYPSSLNMETAIFGSGKAVFDGNANFLAKPKPSVKGTFKLEKIPLDYFKPIVARFNLAIHAGVFSMTGNTEYSPTVASVRIEDMAFQGLKMDYVHSAKTAKAEKKRAKNVGKAAGKVSNKPQIQLRVDKMRLTGSDIGVVNKDATPAYRVFLADMDLVMSNLTNHFEAGPAKAELSGKFMGSGATKASAVFRPETNGPDLDMSVKIVNTRLKDMNDLFRAYGKFDVSKGLFHFYSDLHVSNNRVSGYIKPLFQEMQVYDKRKDQEKSAFRKLYEMLVGGVAKLLENRPRSEMATKVDISGPMKQPQMSTWQVLVELVTNAFFKAILPGFERQVTSAGKG